MIVENPISITEDGLRELARRAKGRITRIFLHWTAGHYGQVYDEYHLNVDRDGTVYVTCDDLGERKAHTWQRNSGTVGITLCCGYGACCRLPYAIPARAAISAMLSRIDMSTILFFLGILMAVACLETIGVLTMLGEGLNTAFNGNYYLINGIIGVLSSIVDNVPLVAGCMGMYPVAADGAMAVDGVFWQLLAYCAGVGGSMLIIGSAAGVVVMGLEKITFGWYMKHITWVAFLGYLAGILCYWLEKTLI